MDDLVSSPTSPNLKRPPAPETASPRKKMLNVKGDQFVMPTPPDTDQSSNVSAEHGINNDSLDRAVSPAPSSSALSSTVDVASMDLVPGGTCAAGGSTTPAPTNQPPAKRRKLNPSEKLEQQRSKEIRQQERAELKARRDEEKRIKDEQKSKKEEERREEKRIKDEERRRKAEEKEAKKREKEVEEERKIQEKLDKERKQMRLGAFFQQKPATPTKQPDNDEIHERARRRSTSLETYDTAIDQMKPMASPAKQGHLEPVSEKTPLAPTPDVSDYHKAFLPFALQTHTVMASLSKEYSETAQDLFDRELSHPSLQEQYDLGMISSYQGHADLSHYFDTEHGFERGLQIPKMRDLIDAIHGTSNQPIDLTGEECPDAMELLRQAPVKHIHFEEDVRPAYCGTYTKIKSPRTTRKVCRSPFTRARQDTNYDYDSEAEWEPPEEGDEEVLSDEEDEVDSQADANDMDFLDDEDDTSRTKRKLITGELVPESTGLCWAGETGHISVVESSKVPTPPVQMQGTRMGFLLTGFSGQTIDPFSTSYWESDTAPVLSSGATLSSVGGEKKLNTMAPPRQPLQQRINGNNSPQHNLVGAVQGYKGPITSASAVNLGAKRGPKSAPKILNKEDLEEFRVAVVSSPLGKLELQKGLKARFPKMTNEVIKETLSSQFAQVGKGKADKRWVFVGVT